MKITLNLSPAASMRDRFALVWAVPATLVGIAALVLLVRASLHEYRDYRGVQRQLLEVQARSDDFHKQEAAIRKKLEDPAYRQLLLQAKFVNKLIDQRELSLTQVNSRVAGLLPEDAQLTGLALMSPKKQGEDYTIRLGINATSEDAIETFINDLEDSADFKDVSIVNQGFQEDAAQGEEINVVCTARYLPGAEEKFEAQSQQPEAAAKKAEVESKVTGAKSQKTTGKTQEPKAESQKSKKGAEPSRAEESTPNHKPSR
ncbi:MAG: hypothetical protein ABSF71_01210 [Terriglobia bacterium]|jgi:hypothetical protein